MRTLDIHGNEIENPDLEVGYLTYETIEHEHPAVPEVKPETKLIQVDKAGRNDVLLERVTVKEWQPPIPAYTTKEQIAIYHPYTAEELAEQDRQRAESEAAAEEAAAQASIMAALPDAVEELAGITAENTETIEVLAGAVEELGTLASAKEDTNG